MKKRILVKVLSCLLAGVMLFEIPLQSYAAPEQEEASVESMADGTALEMVPEETSGEQKSVIDSDLIEQPGDMVELESIEEPGAVEEAEEPENPEESEIVEEPGDAEELGTAEKTEDIGETGNAVEPDQFENPEEVEEPEQPVESETVDGTENSEVLDDIKELELEVSEPELMTGSDKSWSIKTSQFGYTAKYADSTIPNKYTEIVSFLQTAFSAKTKKPDLSELSLNETLTWDILKDCITYVVENNSYSDLLPEVYYSTNGTEVTSVTFSYIADGTKLGLQSAVSSASGVTLGFSVLNGVEWYEIWRKPADETDADVQRVTGFDPSNYAGTFLDTTANEVRDYVYIIYGYEQKDGALVTYSNLKTCKYAFDRPGLTVEPSNKNGVVLQWNVVSAADNYTIYRRLESETEFKVLTTVGKELTSYVDKVSQSNNYVYRIVANGTVSGESRSSSPSQATIKWDQQLSAPVVTYTSSAGDRITLNWNAVSGAKAYVLYKYENGVYQKVRALSATHYNITGLEVGTVYRYAVRAYKTEGSTKVYSGMSNIRTARTTMAAVKLQANAISYNTIRLVWGKNVHADGYEIWRKDQSGTYKRITTITSPDTRAYNDTTAIVGQLYAYKVRPIKTVGSVTYRGNYSTVVSARTRLQNGKITAVNSVDYQSLKITWSKIPGASGYELYRSTSASSGFSLAKRITSGGTVSFQNSGLKLNQVYYYRVRAYRTVNGKRVYGSFSSVVRGKVVLSAPTGIKASIIDYKTFEISWNKVAGAQNYQVYYATSKDGEYKLFMTTSQLKARLTNVLCGQTYYFKVRACKKVGAVNSVGGYSTLVSKTTSISKPSTPTVSTKTWNTITLKWNSVTGAQRYQIYWSTSKTSGYKLLTTTTTTSCKQTNVSVGINYYYKVRAVRDKCITDFSGILTAKTSLGTLSGLKATGYGSDDAIKVSWNKVDGVTRYVIARATSKDGTYSQIAEVANSSFVDLNVSSSKTYYYKVYGTRGTNKTNTAGPISAKTKIVAYGVDVSSYQGTIDWEKVADDNIGFAMIRVVTGKGSSIVRDTMFKENYNGARKYGIKVGVYRYSYATSRTQARAEAEAVIDALNGRDLDYPIVLDVEDSSILSDTSSNSRRSEIILAFKEVVEDAGYDFALYANTTWLNNYLDMDQLKNVDIWIARWRSLDEGHGYTGKGNVAMWQYSNSGNVDGISGKVDLNVSYKNY